MKKIFAAIAAVTVCAVMFTACGGKQDTVTTSETTAAVSEETKSAAAEDAPAESETTETTEAEETAEAEEISAEVYSFASLDEFADSGYEALTYTAVNVKDSNTYDFVMDFEGATSMYIDAEETDGTTAMTMALDAENRIAMDVTADGARSIIIIKDMKMYMLDPATSTGYYMTIDESIFEEYDLKEAFSEIASFDESDISDSEEIMSCKVSIGGEDYTAEKVEDGCMLFNADGSIYAIVGEENDSSISALIINSMSSEVPDSAFDIPDGYTLSDLMAEAG